MGEAITFGEIRPFVSRLDRISVCMRETRAYENFERIRDVPHSYDEKYLRGFGMIESEFEEEGRSAYLPCLEIVLSETPRQEGGGTR